MRHSLYHPSGQASLPLLRQTLELMPNAITLTDAETSECLAMSPMAEALFGVDGSRLLQAINFQANPRDWQRDLRALEAAGGGPIPVSATLVDSQGRPFPAIGHIRLLAMAGRRVIIAAIEPGYPLESPTEVETSNVSAEFSPL